MWWWQAAVLVATMVTAQQFVSDDDSDYMDVYEDVPISSSVWVSDILSTQSGSTRIIQGEVEKLLGQPVIHYEEPDNSLEEPSSTDEAPTRSRIRSSQSHFEEPWNELTEGIGLRGFKAMKSKPRGRHRMEEVVYSVRAPQWDEGSWIKQKARPGVIESLVNAHEVTRYEAPRRQGEGYSPPRPYGDPALVHGYPTRAYGANQTAYNEGGFRHRTSRRFEDYQNFMRHYASGRRNLGLVTVPGAQLTATTKRPRPTPVSKADILFHKYTRKTKKHPNCTDSYYDCLLKCFDKKGYRIRCPWDKPTKQRVERINFTGLFGAVYANRHMHEYDVSDIFQTWRDNLVKSGYRDCENMTTATTTTEKEYPIYYDEVASNATGSIVAKCWVCGLHDFGIPRNSHCSDNFRDVGNSMALSEKNTYRRYCRFMDEVPLWYNRSDPFSIYGPWTGGCSWRWLDLTGLYTQRTCRSLTLPATGNHFLSKRMASLELALSEVKEGCLVSPMATLVPFSRAISLYARFHVCVCRGQFCNHATRTQHSSVLIIIPLALYAIRGLKLLDIFS